jgi:hypothetical protein
MIRMKFQTLALASILTLPLATTACSPGQSPTEPAFDDETAAVSSVTDESRRGRGGKNDDNKDDDKNDDKGRRGRGRRGDDRGNDDRRGGDRAPRGGQEVEGAVASVGASSLTLTNGTRIVVNGSTQWSARGDLFSLSQVAGSLSAGRNPRAEARGTRQSDGALLAATIKAEDEEDD